MVSERVRMRDDSDGDGDGDGNGEMGWFCAAEVRREVRNQNGMERNGDDTCGCFE